MSETPYVDVWHAVLSKRMERNAPRIVQIHMHPRDAIAFELEVRTTVHLRDTIVYSPYSRLRLFNAELRVQSGIAEGWMVLETDRHPTEPAGFGIAMHQFRCLEHEDCRTTRALGFAYWAKRSAE